MPAIARRILRAKDRRYFCKHVSDLPAPHDTENVDFMSQQEVRSSHARDAPCFWLMDCVLDLQTLDFLQSDKFVAETKILCGKACTEGISGVPFTVVCNKWAISGGQSADVYYDVSLYICFCSSLLTAAIPCYAHVLTELFCRSSKDSMRGSP